jgi:hypothetical protein
MLIVPRHSTLKPAGGLLEDGRQVADLLQCCHCQYTWRLQPGSGRLRGFCYRCMRVTCGKPECMVCRPADAED